MDGQLKRYLYKHTVIPPMSAGKTSLGEEDSKFQSNRYCREMKSIYFIASLLCAKHKLTS